MVIGLSLLLSYFNGVVCVNRVFPHPPRSWIDRTSLAGAQKTVSETTVHINRASCSGSLVMIGLVFISTSPNTLQPPAFVAEVATSGEWAAVGSLIHR